MTELNAPVAPVVETKKSLVLNRKFWTVGAAAAIAAGAYVLINKFDTKDVVVSAETVEPQPEN